MNPILPLLPSHQTLDSTVSTSFLHHLHEPAHAADAGARSQGASRGGDHAAALPGFAEVFDHAVADLLVGQSRQNPVPERPSGFSNIMVSNTLSLPLVETFNAITLPRLL